MDAVELAGRFGLGRAMQLSDGPVARGKEGLVWRLDTADGSWAVKVPFDPAGEDEVGAATAFHEAACAAGVPAPQVRRTTDGHVLATIAGRQVRVYQWVDVRPPDPGLDPAQVGAVVAAIHRLGRQADPQLQTRGSNKNSDQAMASLSRVGHIGAGLVLPGYGNPWMAGIEAAVASAKRIGCR